MLAGLVVVGVLFVPFDGAQDDVSAVSWRGCVEELLALGGLIPNFIGVTVP